MRSTIRLPAETIVSRVFKKPGDSLAFGEPVALLLQSQQQKYLFSPVVGTLRGIDVQAGPGGEFATFEGRKPSIGFRHVKHALLHLDASSSSSSSSAAPAAKAPAPAAAAASAYAPSFGRLPPLTDKETALLHSGLASDVW